MKNIPSAKSFAIGAVLTAVLLVVIYTYPRWLIAQLGESNPWTSYLYQYGFGLIFFLMGIYLILKEGSCKPGRGRDSFWLKVLFAGFIFFASAHALWIVASLNIPYLGGQ
jgi:drug/metabolite transporter (DMT)-like permease